jgi:hypothetical protein
LSIWYGSQAANNTFTLLGAIATASATIAALYLSRAEERRLRSERIDRARLCASIVSPSILRTLERIRRLLKQIDFDAEAQAMHEYYSNAISQVMSDLQEPVDIVDLETALALAPLGRQIGHKLASALASFGIAQNRQSSLLPYTSNTGALDPQHPPEAILVVRTHLKAAEQRLNTVAGLLSVYTRAV